MQIKLVFDAVVKFVSDAEILESDVSIIGSITIAGAVVDDIPTEYSGTTVRLLVTEMTRHPLLMKFTKEGTLDQIDPLQVRRAR